MKSFLIIGMGRFGYSIAKELYKLGNEVVAVDRDSECINKVADYVTHAMAVDITDEHVLATIGPRNFDHVIVSFSNNIEDNILLTVMLKNMGVEDLIVKGRDDLHIKVLEKLGADRIVFPERDMGVRMAQVLSNKNMLEFIDVGEDFGIADIKAPQRWVGKSLGALSVRARHGLNVLAVKDINKSVVNPSPGPEWVVREGDILMVMGKNKDIEKTHKL